MQELLFSLFKFEFSYNIADMIKVYDNAQQKYFCCDDQLMVDKL